MKTTRMAFVFAALALASTACSKPPPPAPPPAAAPAPPPPPPPTVQLNGAEIPVGDIEFDTAAATLHDTKTTRETLGGVVKILKDNPGFTKIRVEGHTDSDGSAATNQTLSENRASAVVKWLVDHGVAASRLHSVGCAAKDPVVPNDSAEHKQKNRRTEFDLEEIDGKPAAGFTTACAPNPHRKH